MRGLKVTSIVASSLIVLAAIVALSMPIVSTSVDYGAFSMSVDGGIWGGGAAQYDEPAFDDDKHGSALRAVGPLLILGLVFAAAGIVLNLLPRTWGAMFGGISTLVAALTAGGALGAAAYGSHFADGFDGLQDLAVGGWFLAIGATFGLVLALIIVLAAPIAALVATSRQGAGGDPTTEAQVAPETAPVRVRPALEPTPLTMQQLIAAGGTLVALVLAAVLAASRVGLDGRNGGTPREYYMWGSKFSGGTTWYHTETGSMALLIALIAFGIALITATLYFTSLALSVSRGDAPGLRAISGTITAGALLIGHALSLAGATAIHGLDEGSATAGIAIALIGLFVTLLSWVPAAIGLTRTSASAT